MKRNLFLFCVLILAALACGKGGLRARYATQTALATSNPALTQPVPPTGVAPRPLLSPTPAQLRQTRTLPPGAATRRAAQTRAPVAPVTPNRAPTRTLPPEVATRRAAQSELLADISYCITGEGMPLLLDILQPRQVRAPAPAVVYVHGGGWTGGDKSEGAGMAFTPELLKRGYIVASVNYRLGPEYVFPAQIEDVLCALRFLRANAGQYGIDPQRIGLIGGSAGGHLVSLAGTVGEAVPWEKLPYAERYDDQSSLVRAVVDLFGPADLTVLFQSAEGQPWRLFGGSGREDPVFRLYSPVTYVNPGDPPFLLLHGEQDEVVPLAQSQSLLAALQAVDVPAELLVVKNAGHSFRPVGGEIDPPMRVLVSRVGEFFDRWLK